MQNIARRTRRISCVTIASAVSLAASPMTTAQIPFGGATLQDVQIVQTDDAVTILVQFSAQPSAATVMTNGDVAVLEVDGVAVVPFSVSPAGDLPVRLIEGQPSGDGGSQLMLTGASLMDAEPVIYRNAILLTARLAPPPPQTSQAAVWHAADALHLTVTRCAQANDEIAADAWNLKALGDVALCSLRAGDTSRADNQLGQLAAFNPDDPRVWLGQAEIALHNGDDATARALSDRAAATGILISAHVGEGVVVPAGGLGGSGGR